MGAKNQQPRDPGRTVPSSLTASDELLNIEFKDLVMMATLGIGALAITRVFLGLPMLVSIGAVACAVLIGFLTIQFKPNHLETDEWLETFVHRFKTPDTLVQTRMDTQRDPMVMDLSKGYEMERDVRDLTKVKKIHQRTGTIELEDGRILAGIVIDPANMALATKEDHERLASEFEQYLNNSLNGPVEIFVTSRPFDAEGRLKHLEHRRTDPDIQSRAIFSALMDAYMTWYPEYLSSWGMFEREYYMIYPVEKDDVYGADRAEETIVEQAVDLPFIGGLIATFVSTTEGMSDEEIKQRQIEEANRRAESGRRGVGSITDVTAQTTTAGELALVLKEYWSGRNIDMDPESAIPQLDLPQKADEGISHEETAKAVNDSGSVDLDM